MRTFAKLVVLAALLSLGSAHNDVDHIIDGINSFLDDIQEDTRGRGLQSYCYSPPPKCGYSPPPPYPPPPSPPPKCSYTPPVSVSSPPPKCGYTPPPKCSYTPPVSVSSPPPKCGYTPPVSVSSPPPKCGYSPPVSVSSPPPKCGYSPPVSVASPPKCTYSPPVSVSAPPPKPKGPWCGWKSYYKTKHGKKYKTWKKNYCKYGQKCCKVPKSWGSKSHGPKCSKKVPTTYKCYWKKCPVWY